MGALQHEERPVKYTTQTCTQHTKQTTNPPCKAHAVGRRDNLLVLGMHHAKLLGMFVLGMHHAKHGME
jgi:hypothetical protein